MRQKALDYLREPSPDPSNDSFLPYSAERDSIGKIIAPKSSARVKTNISHYFSKGKNPILSTSKTEP